MHTPPLSLEAIDDHAVVTEARREKHATESAAAIERHGIRTFSQTAMAAIETAHHASVCLVGLEQIEKGSTAPPERVALQVERLGRIDADAANDVAPSVYNEGVAAGLPTSPLPPPTAPTGFR